MIENNIYFERVHDYKLAQGEFVVLFYDLGKRFNLKIMKNLGSNISELGGKLPQFCYYFNLWERTSKGKVELWADGPWVEIDINAINNEKIVKNDLFRR